MFKNILKKLIPPLIISWYHKILAYLAMIIYLDPSAKLIVIGVTGTNGKSTVVNLIGEILNYAEQKTGWTSTTNFSIGKNSWLNDKKMTMLGRFQTQSFLKKCVKEKCKYVIIETSSEGIKQYRHLGINYDMIVFTNLTPEHIESHGSYELYKQTKGRLFKHLTNKRTKLIDKTVIVNDDDLNADYFLSFKADRKITYSIKNDSEFRAKNIELTSNGTIFKIEDETFKTNLLGSVNIYNSLAAISVCKILKVDDQKIREALLKYQGVPGRFEFINQGQNFKVMVDYAPEIESMNKLYETIKLFDFNKIIHVLGSCGGGRDLARRPVLGKIAALNADYVIITNEDPYDDDPLEIIDQVATGALNNGKTLDQDLFKILDRKEAVTKALSLAKENDLVLITGKGSEQAICIEHGKKIPWDDRQIIKELLKFKTK